MNNFPQYLRKSLAFIGVFSFIFIQSAPIALYATIPSAEPASHVIYDTAIMQDTFVDQDVTGAKNTTNYGTATNIDVKSLNGKNRRIFIQANTPSLPSGAVLDSVHLNVYLANPPSTSIRLYSISQVTNSWNENTITWDNQPLATTTPIAIHGIYPVYNSWVTFEVTSDVKSVLAGESVNNGWMIRDRFENSNTQYWAEFRSREYSGVCEGSQSPLCKPYLEITYHFEGSITGNVWEDVNANGIKDEGELPKADELILIYNSDTNITATTTSDGIYSIGGLPSGEYKVCRSSLNTTTQTSPVAGALCPSNTKGAYVQVSGNAVTGPDFGVFQGGSVKVILNTNPTLTEDAFTFDLAKDAMATSSHTFFSGQNEYVFTGAMPGNYSLAQTMPSWWSLGESSCTQGEIAYASTSFPVSAGIETVCTFSNIKKSSLTVTNYVEPAVGTYSFTLTSDDGQTNFGPIVIENAQSHGFISLAPGMYTLTETIENPLDVETAVCTIGDTTVDPRSGPLEIPAGANIQCVYNHSQFGVVSGVVFEDMNGDTVRDDIDTSLVGWLVRLYKITEEMIMPEGSETAVSTTVTTEVSSKVTTQSGYVFGQLAPGTYKVCEEVQNQFIQALPLSNEGCDSSRGYTFTVGLGEIASKHFSNFGLGKLSGVVFSDLNNNGTQDEGEAGIPNVTVYLGNFVTTDANGMYHLDELMPGKYTISLTGGLPVDATYSTPISGKRDLTVYSRGEYTHQDFGISVAPVTPPVDTGSGNGSGDGSGNGGGNTGGETASTTPPTTDTSGGNGGGGSGGGSVPVPANGPIVASFGGGLTNILNGIGGSVDDTTLPSVSTTAPTKTELSNSVANASNSNSGIPYGNTEDAETPTLADPSDTATSTEDSATTTLDIDNTDQTAAVGMFGNWSNWYWLWLFILLVIIGGVYYSSIRSKKR